MIETHPASVAGASVDFEVHRPRLMGLAYRFLGSVTDAEDVVQETYLRWAASDRQGISNPAAYLGRIAARLCLDQLKSARARRESYVGPWLPEPVLQAANALTSPPEHYAADVSVALLLALERLSPLERAAFLLHDVFGLDFDEVAEVLERSATACRQLAVRARAHVRAARPRFRLDPAAGHRIATAFQEALTTGDIAGFGRLLARDAVLHSDSGGRVRAARRLIVGRDRVARLFASLTRRHGPPRHCAPVVINGLPGLLLCDAAGVWQTLALEMDAGVIAALYLVRNPDKLSHLVPHLGSGSAA